MLKKFHTLLAAAVCSLSLISNAACAAEPAFQAISITKVFGDGQKPAAAALLYPQNIDPATVTESNYSAAGQRIISAHTNSSPSLTDKNVPGPYVILRFAYENSTPMTMPPRTPGQKPAAEIDGGKLRPENDTHRQEPQRDLSVTVTQTGAVNGMDGTVYYPQPAGVRSDKRIDLVLEDFCLLQYYDRQTDATIPYSLYLPKNYSLSKKYPLLFFISDAGANSDDPICNLTRGNGATIWAEPQEQDKHECIILAPQYTTQLINKLGALTTDDNVWSDGLTLVENLLMHIIRSYNIDTDRIYGTGQSQGCMTNIAISDKYPELFTAQLLIAGQWNPEEMAAMKDKKLWIVVCEGDTKAYPGMNAAVAKWEELGSKVAKSPMWNSTAAPAEIARLAERTLRQNCKINYTVLQGGSHQYTWSVAYNYAPLRDWLFAQTKNN